MAYEIQALIGKAGAFSRASTASITVVPLPHGMELIPIGNEVQERLGIPFLPLTDEGHDSMPVVLDKLCKEFSANSKVAYIEAEFFGGDGTQAYALYEDGKLIEGPATDPWSINKALKALGVESNVHDTDEFDFVGLGKHRSTNQWL